MVVEYIAIRCFSCGVFQVQQQKKKNEFQCRVCGTKQSVRKVYARSYKAADIRPLVQEYNMKRGEKEEQEAAMKKVELQRKFEENQINTIEDSLCQDEDKLMVFSKTSTPIQNNWQQYVDDDNNDDNKINEYQSGQSESAAVSKSNDRRDIEFVTELPTRTRQLSRRKQKRNDICSQIQLKDEEPERSLLSSHSVTLPTKRKSNSNISQSPNKTFKSQYHRDVKFAPINRKVVGYRPPDSSNTIAPSKYDVEIESAIASIRNDSNELTSPITDEFKTDDSNGFCTELIDKKRQNSLPLTTTKTTNSNAIVNTSTDTEVIETRRRTPSLEASKPKPSYWDQLDRKSVV